MNRTVLILFLFVLGTIGAGIPAPLWSSEVEYLVGVGDLLFVQVLSEKEFSGKFRVGSDGSIDYPYLRKIDVSGKTTEELSKLLSKKLRDGYLADPQVLVQVAEYRSQKVLVLGAVKNPGTFILKEDTRLLDLISRAGGITQAGSKRILLLRGGTVEPVVVAAQEKRPTGEEPTSSGSTSTDTEIDSLRTALSSSRAKPLIIDYYRLVHEGDFSQNLLLRGGDIINVPKANEIFVMGMVARPGPIKYEEKMGILQAVTLAGGPTPIASTKSTYILRQSDKGEEKIKIRLDKIMENKAKNIVLEANDVIVVPESFF